MLRRGNGTQKEHADIARLCWLLIGDHFPDVNLAVEAIERDRKLKEELFRECEQILTSGEIYEDDQQGYLYDAVYSILRKFNR